MRPAPPPSTIRPRNTRPARCVTRRCTGRISTAPCSNRGPAMNTRDLEKGRRIGSTGNRAAAKQVIAAARFRSFSMRLLVLGLALAVAGSAKAQTPQPDQTLALTTPAAASQAAPQASSPNESTNKTAGDYTVQQSIEFGYRDSLINGNLNNYDTFENLTSGVRLFDYSVDMRSIDHKGIFFDNLS